MIVLNAGNFHALFRDIPALIASVDAHVQAVNHRVPIANLAEFATRIKVFPAMAVKLARIIERGDMNTRKPEELRKYGEDYSIEVDWQDGKMLFDGSVAKQWNILRLLDEANTLGPVTGNKYENIQQDRALTKAIADRAVSGVWSWRVPVGGRVEARGGVLNARGSG